MSDYEDHLEDALSETTEPAEPTDRFSVPDPALRREGETTVYDNFDETVDRLDREPDHVLRYLKRRLGTRASRDERGRARLVGSFSTDRVRELIDDYVAAFVTCPECGSPDTHLEREAGTVVLRCDACGARTAVTERE